MTTYCQLSVYSHLHIHDYQLLLGQDTIMLAEYWEKTHNSHFTCFLCSVPKQSSVSKIVSFLLVGVCFCSLVISCMWGNFREVALDSCTPLSSNFVLSCVDDLVVLWALGPKTHLRGVDLHLLSMVQLGFPNAETCT